MVCVSLKEEVRRTINSRRTRTDETEKALLWEGRSSENLETRDFGFLAF